MNPSFFCAVESDTKIGSPMEEDQGRLKRQKGISYCVCLKMQ